MKQSANFSLKYKAGIAIASVLFLAGLSCIRYNPSFFPSYDCLNPGAEVRKNPISSFADPITHESLFIVNTAFLQWVDELKQEIIKLRKSQ